MPSHEKLDNNKLINTIKLPYKNFKVDVINKNVSLVEICLAKKWDTLDSIQLHSILAVYLVFI